MGIRRGHDYIFSMGGADDPRCREGARVKTRTGPEPDARRPTSTEASRSRRAASSERPRVWRANVVEGARGRRRAALLETRKRRHRVGVGVGASSIRNTSNLRVY